MNEMNERESLLWSIKFAIGQCRSQLKAIAQGRERLDPAHFIAGKVLKQLELSGYKITREKKPMITPAPIQSQSDEPGR